MIKDNIKNAEKYFNLPERVKLGLKYLIDTDFSAMENGKYEISTGEVFAIIQSYTSKPKKEGKFEAHKKYIDIQYIFEGEEQIGVSDIENFREATKYDKDKDIVFLAQKKDVKIDFISLKENDFAVFTPTDAHMPSITIKNHAFVRKVVVKVLA